MKKWWLIIIGLWTMFFLGLFGVEVAKPATSTLLPEFQEIQKLLVRDGTDLSPELRAIEVYGIYGDEKVPVKLMAGQGKDGIGCAIVLSSIAIAVFQRIETGELEVLNLGTGEVNTCTPEAASEFAKTWLMIYYEISGRGRIGS